VQPALQRKNLRRASNRPLAVGKRLNTPQKTVPLRVSESHVHAQQKVFSAAISPVRPPRRPWSKGPLLVLPAGLLSLSSTHWGWENLLLLLACAIFAVLVLRPKNEIWPIRLGLCDWGMLLVLVYEVPALILSRYRSNGFSSLKTVCAAAMFYCIIRLAARQSWRVPGLAAAIGTGGVYLSWLAISQAGGEIGALAAVGFSDLVSFRSRLVSAPWIPGEWFTLVLLTLPFAFAVPAFFCAGRQWNWAAVTVPMALVIAAALLLSCSRAVAGGVIVFVLVVTALAAAYRVVRLKTAAIFAAGALCTLGLVLLAENAMFPGIAEAYVGRHASQTRSTEGRLAIWKRSAEVFATSPWWGVGSGKAPLFLASSADEAETTGFASRTFSLPIQILTEKGAIGAAIYLTVLILAGWEAHRKLRNPKTSPQMKAMTCCFAAGVIAVLFRELTYSSLLEHAATAMLFTMCLALLVAEEEAA